MPVHSSAVDATRLVAAVRGLADRLERHRTELNRLNVYPVPDGDTGDNLLATITTVVEALPASTEHTEIVQTIARGALFGGRGSSGVIFGQALRRFVETLPDPCGPEGLAAALEAAAEAAWQAIADPVEGTILTVARAAARQARAVATYGSLADVVGEAAAEGRRSLARTPDLLPALARAGVVDAGGLGYVLFLDALAEAVAGLESAPIELAAPVLDPARGGLEDVEEAPVATMRYEVVCLLQADDEHVARLREQWVELGDTVAIAGGHGAWRSHVHTNDVTAALAAARRAGEVSQVEVTDLAEQAEHEVGLHAVRPGGGTASIVTVAEGDGLVAAYLEAGAHRVVTGGATSKPSTGELLRVIDACAGPVVLLAGDTDVVPAAERALEHSAAPGRLVAVDMLAGLIALDTVGPPGLDGDVGAVADRLAEAARQVRTVNVRRAVRPARTELGAVRRGDWLAIGDSGLVTVAPTAGEALLTSAAAVVAPTARAGLVALDMDAEDGDVTAQKLHAAHPQVAWRTVRANRRTFAYGMAVR